MSEEIHATRRPRFADALKTAQISQDRKYRYVLTRQWLCNPIWCAFVMLNPSTADHEIDDNTIRKCMGFADSWGFGAITVVNVFAYRATDPRTLLKVEAPVGPDNAEHIQRVIETHPTIIAAWGASFPKPLYPAVEATTVRLRSRPNVHILGLTRDGHPRHPLYLKATTKPSLWLS